MADSGLSFKSHDLFRVSLDRRIRKTDEITTMTKPKATLIHFAFYLMVFAACLGNEINATSTNNSNLFTAFILFTLLGAAFFTRPKIALKNNAINLLSLALVLTLSLSMLLMVLREPHPLGSLYYMRWLGLSTSIAFIWALIHYMDFDKISRVENIFFSFVFAFWIIAIFGFFRAYLEGNFNFGAPPFFINIRHAAFLCAALVAPTLFLYLYSKNKASIFIALGTLSLLLAFIILSGARAASLALLCSTFFSWLLLRKTQSLRSFLKPGLTIALSTTIVSIGIAQLIPHNPQALSSRIAPTVTSIITYSDEVSTPATTTESIEATIEAMPPAFPRISIWKESLNELSINNLWFGLGPDAYRKHVDYYQVVQPHNSIVLALIEWGVMGTLVIISLLTLMVRKGILSITTMPSSRARSLHLTGFFTFSTLSLIGMFDGTYYHAFSLFFLFLSMALMLKTFPPRNTPPLRKA